MFWIRNRFGATFWDLDFEVRKSKLCMFIPFGKYFVRIGQVVVAKRPIEIGLEISHSFWMLSTLNPWTNCRCSCGIIFTVVRMFGPWISTLVLFLQVFPTIRLKKLTQKHWEKMLLDKNDVDFLSFTSGLLHVLDFYGIKPWFCV